MHALDLFVPTARPSRPNCQDSPQSDQSAHQSLYYGIWQNCHGLGSFLEDHTVGTALWASCVWRKDDVLQFRQWLSDLCWRTLASITCESSESEAWTRALKSLKLVFHWHSEPTKFCCYVMTRNTTWVLLCLRCAMDIRLLSVSELFLRAASGERCELEQVSAPGDERAKHPHYLHTVELDYLCRTLISCFGNRTKGWLMRQGRLRPLIVIPKRSIKLSSVMFGVKEISTKMTLRTTLQKMSEHGKGKTSNWIFNGSSQVGYNIFATLTHPWHQLPK